MSVDRVRVLVADDHPTLRAGVRSLLELTGDVAVVAECSTSEDAVHLAGELLPDVVVMDLRMPVMGGVEATRAICRTAPGVAVLVLTMVDDADSIFAALRAGARGYLLKESGSGELHRAVQAVAGGGFITSPAVATRVTEFFAGATAPAAGVAFPDLTHREREILDLIAQGRSNTAIAQHLYVSAKTVRNHISNIFAKLHAADRSEAIVRAREAGLGRRDP